MTVLQWLHCPKKQQVFVANKVGERLDQSLVDECRQVKGTMNAADIGTRGVTSSHLLESEWLNRPPWLKRNAESWPEQAKLVEDDDIVLMTNPSETVIDLSRFNKYKRLTNVVFYCLRFRSKQCGIVTALDRQKAQLLIVQQTRRKNFAELFNKLEDNSGERVKHDLEKLSPFVDTDSIIRVKGRLSRTTVSENWNTLFYSQPSFPLWFWSWERRMNTTTMRVHLTWEFWFNNDFRLLDNEMHCAASSRSVANAESS